MKRRMTLIELLALILIVCEIAFLCIKGYDWMNIHVCRGNDANYVNTCESVAKVNSLIVAHKTKGYNSCKNPEVHGKEYSGNAGEMILEVIVKDGTISVQWTGGKQ